MTNHSACPCCQRRPLLQGMAALLLSPGWQDKGFGNPCQLCWPFRSAT